jgi:ATP-binding cassette subfamily B protein
VLIRVARTYLRPYRLLIALTLVLQFGQVVASLLLPTLSARIIDQGALTGDTDYILRMGSVLMAITAVQVVLAIVAVRYASRLSMALGRDLRNHVFRHVTALSAREVTRFGTPSLITRVTNDVQQVQMFVFISATIAVTAPMMLVVGGILAVREAGALALILCVVVPLMVLVLGDNARRMHPSFVKLQATLDRANQVLREQITGIRVVRAFVREPDERVRFGVVNDELTGLSLRTGRLMAMSVPVLLACMNLGSVAAVWFGADLIGSGKLQVGSLVAFLSYLVQILVSVMTATMFMMMLPRASVGATRISEVLDAESTVVAASEGVRALAEPISLELHHASFAFPGAEQPVLRDISFRVDAGETLAIVGSTGAGKSALVNLVARQFDATEGSVTFGDTDIRDLDLDYFSSLLGLVPQKPFLFSGTVASNLRFGRPDATDHELWTALEVAQAADFVRTMPDGLDSPISQGGANVSGGQRQRLAIARAVVHRPAVYLFDDSFSALDLRTDARLRAALRPVTRDAVTVVVAQRVSTIIEADHILVLEEGRIVGLGPHAELLDTCPTYVEIIESQHYDRDAA